MARVKVSLSLDPVLVRDVDAYVAAHADADRSGVVDEALRLWSAAQLQKAMAEQFADDDDTPPAEYAAWRRTRRAAADRRLHPR